MDINEIYQNLIDEGRSVGHAQWIIGNYYLTGRNVEPDLGKAEEWFLKAWDHKFPGTAKTQAFVLRRQWEKYIAEAYRETPRMKALLTEANTLSDEQHGAILIPVHNDAQKEWLDSRIEEMAAAFRQFTKGRFLNISIFSVVR